MNFKNLFPCAIGAFLALSMSAVAVSAQTRDIRPRQIAQNLVPNGPSVLTDEPVIVSLASPEDIKAAASLTFPGVSGGKFQEMMLAAIDQRLGAPYVWGATGPTAFDCSGLVWSVFQSAGITFERGSARTLWTRFAPATLDEQSKFGTLVFFSNLKHIGIVADENGFYHASRHHGVVYAPFNDYWRAHIDGFRRVPLSEIPVTE
ncbi:MAG: C40 family peptidase [bacterium]